MLDFIPGKKGQQGMTSRYNYLPKTLEDFRDRICEEVPWIDIKPYSHNIIGLVLSQIAKEFGNEEANKVIEDYGLEGFGWKKVEINTSR